MTRRSLSVFLGLLLAFAVGCGESASPPAPTASPAPAGKARFGNQYRDASPARPTPPPA
jgi:hypothetical protein